MILEVNERWKGETMTPGATGDEPDPKDGAASSNSAHALETPPSGVPAVNGCGPLRRTVRIVNPLGLHMRAADKFVRAAKRYNCKVVVWHGDTTADGKDLWALILLTVMPNAEVTLELDGDDATDAIEPLCEILAAHGGEDYTN